jgi:hypothetical protein
MELSKELNEAVYKAVGSSAELNSWLASPAVVVAKYHVTTDNTNPKGKVPNSNNGQLLASMSASFRPIVDKFIELKINRGINPNTLTCLSTILTELYRLFGLKFPAVSFQPLAEMTMTDQLKNDIKLKLANLLTIYGNDEVLVSFIETLGDKVDIDDIFLMTNLHTLLTAINDYTGDARDFRVIYDKLKSQGGGRKLTRRRKSNSKSKRYNKHRSKRRRSSHNKRI